MAIVNVLTSAMVGAQDGPSREGGARESLLVLSDVHLGSDLNVQAMATGFGRRSKSVDADLAELLRHYRRTPPEGDRWRIVIAGDFIDFIGMALPPDGAELATAPSEEELAHGLGNAADHAGVKLRRVAERHEEVLAALAGFVADGHALTIVHGNHDVEFHWENVRDEFKAILRRLAGAPREGVDGDAFVARIDFQPWFFYVGGVAYIEHGHQYDPYCATDLIMAPLSPLDPRRIARGFSDVLLRYVVRPTKGLREWGHEHLGLVDYIRFGAQLGARGMVTLGVRFASAVIELFRLRREHFAEARAALREEHERRVALLAEATRIGVDRLRALGALQVPPITRSIRGILASVLLDRLALALVAAAGLVGVAISGAQRGHAGWAVALILMTWALLHRYLTTQRQLDPAEQLVDRAAKLAKLFPAAFVVMGHTHIPVEVPVNDGSSTYINLGSWAENEEPEADGASPHANANAAARTHLVIHPGAAGAVAEFLKWDSTDGPSRFVSTHLPGLASPGAASDARATPSDAVVVASPLVVEAGATAADPRAG